ncbi:putative G-protein coupled receptor 125 [Arapaima gigas]
MRLMATDLLWIAVVLLLLRGGRSALPPDCKYEERSKRPPEGGLDRKVVCSNLELRQVLEPERLPNRTVTLILSNNKIEELKNGSFAGLSALERL